MQTKTQATAVAKEQFNVKTVALNAKQSALFLVPDLSDYQELAVIDSGVLKYLTELLPSANYWEIASAFRNKCKSVDNLKDLVAVAKEFVVFHESVNLLERFFDPKAEVVIEKPFNVVEEKSFEQIMIDTGHMKGPNDEWIYNPNDAFVTMMIDNHYELIGTTWFKRPVGQPVEKAVYVKPNKPQVVDDGPQLTV